MFRTQEDCMAGPPRRRLALATLCLLAAAGASKAPATDLATAMQPIAGTISTPPQKVARDNVLALNTAMFELYGDAAKLFQRNMLNRHPVILGLFSGAGGRLILYRPGMEPLDTPPVPEVYQLLKSVGHSTMALSQVVGPYLDNAANQAWRAPMLACRARMTSALETLDAADMPGRWRDTTRAILQGNMDFMDASLARGAIATADLQAFAARQRPLLGHVIAWAAQTQVSH